MQESPRPTEKAETSTNLKMGLVWAAACLLLIAIVWMAALTKIERDEQQLIDKLRIDTEQRARNHAEQLLRTISQIDQLSISIKYQWEEHGVPNDLEEQFRRGLYRESMFPVAIDANGYALTNTRNLKRGTYMGAVSYTHLTLPTKA